MKKNSNKGITNKDCSDTGMAMALIAILAGMIYKQSVFQIVALIAILVNMIVPSIFRPLAFLWFGLSRLMGYLSSKLLLGLVFFFVVTPVGLIRKLMGKDRLSLRAFKKDNKSAFNERFYMYNSSDLNNTF